MIDVVSVFVLDQQDFILVLLKGKVRRAYQRGRMEGIAVSWVKLGGSKLGHEM